MSETWTPPVAGSPCWVEIPGTDVPRAKQFYSKVFHWSFHAATADCPESKIALFDFPDKKFPASGGICAVCKEAHISSSTAAAAQCKKAIKLYLYVDGDLEEKMEVCRELASHSEPLKNVKGSRWVS